MANATFRLVGLTACCYLWSERSWCDTAAVNGLRLKKIGVSSGTKLRYHLVGLLFERYSALWRAKELRCRPPRLSFCNDSKVTACPDHDRTNCFVQRHHSSKNKWPASIGGLALVCLVASVSLNCASSPLFCLFLSTGTCPRTRRAAPTQHVPRMASWISTLMSESDPNDSNSCIK